MTAKDSCLYRCLTHAVLLMKLNELKWKLQGQREFAIATMSEVSLFS
jgi:hypothetical protein